MKRNLKMIMKFLTSSFEDPRRLFVPINEFEFSSFAVRVRRLSIRQVKAPRAVFRITRRRSRNFWSMAPLPAAV